MAHAYDASDATSLSASNLIFLSVVALNCILVLQGLDTWARALWSRVPPRTRTSTKKKHVGQDIQLPCDEQLAELQQQIQVLQKRLAERKRIRKNDAETPKPVFITQQGECWHLSESCARGNSSCIVSKRPCKRCVRIAPVPEEFSGPSTSSDCHSD